MSVRNRLTEVSTRKVIATLAATTLAGVAAVTGTTAALTDTTVNSANEFDAAAIDLTDNDAGSFMYDVDNQEPGMFVEKCIQISYTGTKGSAVSLFMDTPILSVGPYVDVVIEAGTDATPAFGDCTSFVKDPDGTEGDLFTGTLTDFQTNNATAATGIVYTPNGGVLPWVNNDVVVYKVKLTLSATARAAGENFSGLHNYTWQADSV